MPRPTRNENAAHNRVTVRFDDHELAEIDAVLADHETRSQIVREGTIREVRRRQSAELNAASARKDPRGRRR